MWYYSITQEIIKKGHQMIITMKIVMNNNMMAK